MFSNTAILIFALDPSEEVKRKKLRKGTILFSALHAHTLSEVRKTHLPFVLCRQESQKGNSFGERFSNAVSHLFDQGFQNIIALGNDCPQLTKDHILQAAAELSLGKNVIAPSLDGGFNLLGIQKQTFEKDIFEALPWQTENLLAQTLFYFSKADSGTELLESFSDVDSIWDVKHLVDKVKGCSLELYALFVELLQTIQHLWRYSHRSPFQLLFSTPFNKGSPLPLF